jgi:hypothetical protein
MIRTANQSEWSHCALRAIGWIRSDRARLGADSSNGGGYVDRIEHPSDTGFLYPETSGYALSVLEWLIASDLGGEPETELVQATQGLLKSILVLNDGGAPGSKRNPITAHLRYSFDTAMVVKGLVAHAKRLESGAGDAIRAGCSFLGGAISDDGVVHPFGSAQYGDIAERWSTRPGPFLLKAVLGWACGLYCLHGEWSEHRRVRRVVDVALGQRDRAGFFVGEPGESLNMHAHLYACEGAYFLGVAYEFSDAIDASARGVEAALRLFRRAEHLPPALDAVGTGAERCDTVAQLLRLAVLLEIGSGTDHEKLATRLAFHQDPASGALYFGTDFERSFGCMRAQTRHISNHSTLFAIQAWLLLVCADRASDWRRQPWLFA